ncbi:MAG: hypothetical protein HYV14_14630 [Elusimicrobia bacterium]|nr:hypothetical protein [Elusimicrobiota bacterium]
MKPTHEDEITIGQPAEADMQYMAGLKATWGPEVTDSGPGVKLAVRIDGSDGKPHFMGATKMDPYKPEGRFAVTLLDGRVLISKDTFQIAVDKKNLGFGTVPFPVEI